jgi:uncharacterized membrane protein
MSLDGASDWKFTFACVVIVDALSEQPDKIREARDLLEREREKVVAALALARARAQEIAEQQKAWRKEAAELLERGDAASLSVTEMAKALGLSRQWTTHLRAEAKRRVRLMNVVCVDPPGPEAFMTRKRGK